MKRLLFCYLVALASSSVNAADFYNLDFDQANTNHLIDPNGFANEKIGTAMDLLPGWSLLVDGSPYTGSVFYKSLRIGQPNIEYFPTPGDYAHDYFFTYGADFSQPNQHAWSMYQVGTIPAGAWQLLTFGGATLYLNGVQQPRITLDGFNQFVFDVHEWAGMEVKLEFRNFQNPGGPYGGFRLDIFGFTTPEPSEWALLAVGGALTAWAVRHRAAR